MEGHGVTNYSVDKPTYAFTSSTTEFDDALMKRGTVSLEDAIMAKGATREEAQRLAHQKRNAKANVGATVDVTTNNNDKKDLSDRESDNDSDFEDDSDDDDDFMQQYRQQRLAQLKQEYKNNNTQSDSSKAKKRHFGQVLPIQRPEWTREVNEDSQDGTFVVVTLLSTSHHDITAPIHRSIGVLASQCPSIKFVSIPSTSAIEDWPDDNLPAVFVYRHGKMIQELIQIPQAVCVSPLKLLQTLRKGNGGVQFTSTEMQQVRDFTAKLEEEQQQTPTTSRSQVQLLRRRRIWDEDDEEDDDEVL